MATLRWMLTLAVAAVFGWSSLIKLVRPERWTTDVRRYRLGQPVKRVAVLVVPWIELGIALALVTGRTRVGAVVAVLALVVFSGAIVRLQHILGTNAVPCGCLGESKSRDYRVMLARNGVLVAAALVLALSPPSERGWHPAPSGGSTAVAVAVLLAAASAWAVWYYAVWSGRVHSARGESASASHAPSR